MKNKSWKKKKESFVYFKLDLILGFAKYRSLFVSKICRKLCICQNLVILIYFTFLHLCTLYVSIGLNDSGKKLINSKLAIFNYLYYSYFILKLYWETTFDNIDRISTLKEIITLFHVMIKTYLSILIINCIKSVVI